jgi:competence protein ComEC
MSVLVVAAAILAAACRWPWSWGVLGSAAVGWIAAVRLEHGRTRALLFLIVVATLGSWRGAAAWEALTPSRLGPYEGWARLVDDPQPYGAATRVIVEIEGERF